MQTTSPLLGSIVQSMKQLSERQRVIAQNIANSETPGFKAQEVEAPRTCRGQHQTLRLRHGLVQESSGRGR